MGTTRPDVAMVSKQRTKADALRQMRRELEQWEATPMQLSPEAVHKAVTLGLLKAVALLLEHAAEEAERKG